MLNYKKINGCVQPGSWGIRAVYGLEVLSLFHHRLFDLLAIAIKWLAETSSASSECILLRNVGLALPRPCSPGDREHVWRDTARLAPAGLQVPAMYPCCRRGCESRGVGLF